MEPRIITTAQKKLVGRKLRMSISANRTVELWQFLMSRRNHILNKLNSDLFSVQVFNQDLDFIDFTPETEFEKWAAVEVLEYGEIPEGLETLTVPNGLYAVFDYKGVANNFAPMFHYIFATWIPSSEYAVDNRPHFALMGEKYRGNSPDSEEEIWVPVKPKQTRNSQE